MHGATIRINYNTGGCIVYQTFVSRFYYLSLISHLTVDAIQSVYKH